MIDEALVDSDGNGIQFFGDGLVCELKKIDGQTNVFLLRTVIELERETQVAPEPGQFYMLRSKKSAAYFGRPISVYRSKVFSENGKRKIELQFMILEKGTGTKELCQMLPGEKVVLSGPMGNVFHAPDCSDGGAGVSVSSAKAKHEHENAITVIKKTISIFLFICLFLLNKRCY